MACMGYGSIFSYLGAEFLLDVHGRKLPLTSKDTRYFVTGGLAVSKFYPMITGSSITNWIYYKRK